MSSFINENFYRRLTEIKSVWLVISEAGNAVCGVYFGVYFLLC